MLLALPGGLWALWDIVWGVAQDPAPFWPLLAGFAGYTLAWKWIFGKRWAGTGFSTLEHELTHALFALLTFHPVVGIHATWSQGGQTRFRGGGNWLLYIAPYFFPTLSVFIAAMRLFFDGTAALWVTGLLGASIAYHILSTWRETHDGQTDFHKAGRLFSGTFLPGANVLAYGFLLGGAMDGWAGVVAYGTNVWSHTHQLLGY